VSHLRCTGLAGALALFLLVGRWGFERLEGGPAAVQPNRLMELRLWLVVAVLLLAAMGLADRVSARAPPGAVRTEPAPRLVAALVLFLGYTGLSALWSPDAAFALEKLYELALVAAMTAGLALGALHLPPGRLLHVFWGTVALVTGVLALVGVRQLLSGGAGRLSVLGGGPNVFARLMGLLMLASLHGWYRSGRAWLWLPVGGTALVLVLLSGSRGGSAAAVAALLVFLVAQRLPLRRIAVLTVLATLIGVAAVKVSPLARPLEQSMQERYLRLTLHYTGRGEEGEQRRNRGPVYLSGRGSLYASALALGKDYPVGGAGLAAFPALGLGVYPHNLFLETFSEGGAVGLVLLALLLLAFAASVWRRRKALDGACLGGVVLVLVGSQVSGDLYDSRGLFLLMLLTAYAAPVPRPVLEPEPEAPLPATPPTFSPLRGAT
jgi:O-antigen ligase